MTHHNAAVSSRPIFNTPFPEPHVLDIVKVSNLREMPTTLRSSMRFAIVPPPLTAVTASARFCAFRAEVTKSAAQGGPATVFVAALEALVPRHDAAPGLADGGWRAAIGDSKSSHGELQLDRRPVFADGGNQTLLAIYLDGEGDSHLTAEVLQDPQTVAALVRSVVPRCAAIDLAVQEDEQVASEQAMDTDAAVASLIGRLPQLSESDLIASQALASVRQLEAIASATTAAAAGSTGAGRAGAGARRNAASTNLVSSTGAPLVTMSVDTVAQAMADAYQAFLAAESTAAAATAATTSTTHAFENSPSLYSADVLDSIGAASVASTWAAALQTPGTSLSELVCALPEVASFVHFGARSSNGVRGTKGGRGGGNTSGGKGSFAKARRPSRADQALLKGSSRGGGGGGGSGGRRGNGSSNSSGKQNSRTRKLQSQVPVDTILAKLKGTKFKRGIGGIGHGGGSSSGNEGGGGSGARLKHYASYDSNSGSGSGGIGGGGGGGVRLQHHASFESYGSDDRTSTSSPLQGSSSSGFGRTGIRGMGTGGSSSMVASMELLQRGRGSGEYDAGTGTGTGTVAGSGGVAAAAAGGASWRVQAQKARLVPFSQAVKRHSHGISYATETGVKEHAKLGKLQSQHVRQDSESKPAALESSRLRTGSSSLSFSATAVAGECSMVLDESSLGLDQTHFTSVFESSAGSTASAGASGVSGIGISHERVAEIIRVSVDSKLNTAPDAARRETSAVLHEMSLPLQRMWPDDEQLPSRVEQFVQANIDLVASIPE